MAKLRRLAAFLCRDAIGLIRPGHLEHILRLDLEIVAAPSRADA